MRLKDEGIIVNKIKYGETSLILSIFTKNHGIQKGIIKGALASKNKFLFELGNICSIEKIAKSEEHLGYLKIEFIYSPLSYIFNCKKRLPLLLTICQLTNEMILEKESHTNFYEVSKSLILLLEKDNYLYNYINWEILLLTNIGYGLDLTHCVITGSVNNLHYLSPKTGKCVIYSEGKKYHDKLFVIPKCFLEKVDNVNYLDAKHALDITGYYLEKFAKEYNKSLPNTRSIFINNL